MIKTTNSNFETDLKERIDRYIKSVIITVYSVDPAPVIGLNPTVFRTMGDAKPVRMVSSSSAAPDARSGQTRSLELAYARELPK